MVAVASCCEGSFKVAGPGRAEKIEGKTKAETARELWLQRTFVSQEDTRLSLKSDRKDLNTRRMFWSGPVR